MTEPSTPPTRKLKPKQRAFLEAYLETWNASEAARRAGYKGDANTVGPRLLANVGIQAAIEERLKEKAMSANEVLARLAEQARLSIADFTEKRLEPILDENGKEIGQREMVGINWESVKLRGHMVKSITSTSNGPKLELHDAQSALIQLGRAHGLFTERVEQHSTNTTVNLYLPKKNDRDS